MEIQVKIGEQIKRLRLAKELTQEELAWRSDVDRTFMNYVENGKRNVTIKSLEKIVVNGLSISLREFFNHEDFS